MFFKDSRPDRLRRAKEKPVLERSAIPPAKHYEILQIPELYALSNDTFTYDVECYANYFLVSFRSINTSKVIYFEIFDWEYHTYFCVNGNEDFKIFTDTLGYILYRFPVVGFNSKVYDLPMCANALDGLTAASLKAKSNELIADDQPKFELRLASVNHIDLIEVAPLQASLKLYGGRIHCERMQDLPYPDNKTLTYEEMCNVRDYNVNDLELTEALYKELKPHLELREFLSKKYGQDLKSKSDAQIGEAIIVSELAKLGVRAKTPEDATGRRFQFRAPDYLTFQTPACRAALAAAESAWFEVAANGRANLPPELDGLAVAIGKGKYKFGIGGLHSCEKSTSHYSTADTMLIDRDVASYYPRIILNQGLFPEHLGTAFLEVYRAIVNTRLLAKREGRKEEADGLKIAINGCFGKLANMFSKLYCPQMLIQITMSGQLFLLMLIETVELAGIEVVSANTDGIIIKCKKNDYDRLGAIIASWEATTGFETEETMYRSIHSRDVNNFIAVKTDGECKVKGCYAEVGSALNSPLSKNPESNIVNDALKAYVANGSTISETVRGSRDFRKFVNVRTVKGGAHKQGTYLGKAIRWYYGENEHGTIQYVLSGNAVPKSEGAKPCMIMPPGMPEDLNYQYYIDEANDALYDLGVKHKPSVGMLL